ncbi:molybdopterin-containing oxidoreductase family protein [Sphingopyxis terrae]|uniref:molybdopterin-containing oxidoreductase family protein n=1 Tax=Sphingopyxis terrae TaxID=33052 RepID=UPI002A0E788D|nr:molybdopterin-dependent oxidoreductase [Sphingopyxis terrae]MDX8356399.1 molybdopterin-dependent oxidoreductase [Sphingopyxis terrae]
MAADLPLWEKHSFCRICEPQCPLVAQIGPDGRVSRLLPNPDHPSGGIACHKGLSYLDVHHDPDRLNFPLQRIAAKGGRARFERTDWDSAMSDIAGRLSRIHAAHGKGAVAVYHGNAFNMCNPTGAALLQTLFDALGTSMIFNSTTQDATNKVAGAIEIYGSIGSIMVPDLMHTDYLLCIGANPRVSRWTFASVPNDDLAILRAIPRRGGKVRFINPRAIESSTNETGPTLLVKPGSDVYFLAALLGEIDRIGGIDEALLARYGRNSDEMRAFVRAYPPERVAEIVGVSADDIREIAAEIVAAPSAAVYMSTGLNQSGQGVLCHWLVEMINFATGNLGRRGGTVKPAGLFPDSAATELVEVETSQGRFELPRPVGPMSLPLAILPELIAAGDVKALIVLGGNPVLTAGGEAALRAAFEQLELMVSFDIYRQTTADLADYILPSTDWIEHMDVNFMISGMQIKPYVQYAEELEPAAAERRNGWWFISRLLQLLGEPSPLDAEPNEVDGRSVVDGILSIKGLTVEKLRAGPSNTVELEQAAPGSVFERCLAHPDGKIDCFPQRFVDKGLFDRFEAQFAVLANEPPDVLKLISLRTRYMHNSWLTNLSRFRHGPNAINPLHMAEADARERRLHEGDVVRLHNEHGEVEAVVHIDPTLRRGVVAMTHGYGQAGNLGLSEASGKPGINCNVVMPVGPGSFEPISHMSMLSAVPVLVERCR